MPFFEQKENQSVLPGAMGGEPCGTVLSGIGESSGVRFVGTEQRGNRGPEVQLAHPLLIL